MARRKLISDDVVLDAALRAIEGLGVEALSFDRVAKACGLSASTLVQRFQTKAGLVRAALHHAWDDLDRATDAIAAECPDTPDGAVELLVRLSNVGQSDSAYVDGLILLREDLRDPELRLRGKNWKQALGSHITRKLNGPADHAEMMVVHWQGLLLWWNFERSRPAEEYLADGLRMILSKFTTNDLSSLA